MGSSSTSSVITAGGFIGNLVGFSTGPNLGTVQTLVASGAIALTNKLALLDGTAAVVAATLADGSTGQEMFVKAINVTNAVTLVPANLRDGTTITFTPANEYVHLIFDGTNWNVVSMTAAVT